MKIIDLTHTISARIPVYPGTEGPRLQTVTSYEEVGYKETLITMFSHTGTHMDTPAHITPGNITLDEFPAEQFVGKGLVIDCTDMQEGQRIGMERINKVREKADRAEFLLFKMGWDARWEQDSYFGDYPCISPEVAQYMIDSSKKGIGLDVIGLDPISDTELTLHHKVLDTNRFVIVENLCNLDQLGDDIFLFLALPLKYENSDGAPVRAIGILD